MRSASNINGLGWAGRLAASLLVAAVVMLALAENASAQRRGGGAPRAALVALDRVIEEPMLQTTPVLGRLIARQAGRVAARVGGAVAEMHADIGDRLAAGDVIAMLVSDRLQAERDRAAAVVAQRRAQLATSSAEVAKKQQELQRMEELRRSAAFSKARYDDLVKDVAMVEGELAESRAQLRQSEAQLALTDIDLAYSTVTAPYAGVVAERHTEVGAFLSRGGGVVSLINDQDIEIEADVPTDRLAGLIPGTVVTVRLDDGTTHHATVRALVPREDPLTRTRPVRFVPSFGPTSKALATNQSVTVFVPIGERRQVVSVHKDAVIIRGGRPVVYVVVDGVAQDRTIELGEATGNRFEVRSGLAPGDQVVTRGNEQLRSGQPVRTAEG